MFKKTKKENYYKTNDAPCLTTNQRAPGRVVRSLVPCGKFTGSGAKFQPVCKPMSFILYSEDVGRLELQKLVVVP